MRNVECEFLHERRIFYTKKRGIPLGMPPKTTKNLKSLFLFLLVKATVVDGGVQ